MSREATKEEIEQARATEQAAIMAEAPTPTARTMHGMAEVVEEEPTPRASVMYGAGTDAPTPTARRQQRPPEVVISYDEDHDRRSGSGRSRFSDSTDRVRRSRFAGDPRTPSDEHKTAPQSALTRRFSTPQQGNLRRLVGRQSILRQEQTGGTPPGTEYLPFNEQLRLFGTAPTEGLSPTQSSRSPSLHSPTLSIMGPLGRQHQARLALGLVGEAMDSRLTEADRTSLTEEQRAKQVRLDQLRTAMPQEMRNLTASFLEPNIETRGAISTLDAMDRASQTPSPHALDAPVTTSLEQPSAESHSPTHKSHRPPGS